METVILHKLKGTRYFYMSTSSWLLDLPQDKIIDIRECKFTTECARILSSLQQSGYRIIDSSDASREELLRLNDSIVRDRQLYSEKSVRLPSLDKHDSLESYINSLDENLVYKRSYEGADDLDIYLIILINMFRPEIKINPTMLTVKILKKIKPHMTKQIVDSYISEHRMLQYAYEDALVPIQLTPHTESVTILSGESVPISTFRLKYILIPYEFGREVCVGGVWDRIFKEGYDYIEWVLKKKKRTLHSLIVKQVNKQ